MHSTRSPVVRVCASAANVMGSDAGPTLPHRGKVWGTLAKSSLTASMIALVWVVLTWWVT